MASSVTLTYDLVSGHTTITENGRTLSTGPERDGIVGLCRTGSLYCASGSSVTYRLRRRPAVVQL